MTVGVEEEFFVVDAETGELATDFEPLLDAARPRFGDLVCPELNRCQIEIQTEVCSTLADVDGNLRQLRTGLSELGAPLGLDIAATATHPSSSWADQEVNRDKEHYAWLEDRFQMVARQQVICGCHVHVGIDDPELAIATMDRVRPWLPVLLALSSNSPFWQGRDTGFASYRTEIWARWPTAGFPPVLGTRAHYDDLVDELLSIGAIDEPASLYWYVRPSVRYPTIELRICDVPLRVEDTVTLAGLVRALVWTARREALDVRPRRRSFDRSARIRDVACGALRAARKPGVAARPSSCSGGGRPRRVARARARWVGGSRRPRSGEPRAAPPRA